MNIGHVLHAKNRHDNSRDYHTLYGFIFISSLL